MAEFPNLTTCSPAEARAQMKHLFEIPAPEVGKLETGGLGRAYIKVWRDRPLGLMLWLWFEPSTKAELAAYERGAETMANNPGARWAVSEPCSDACAGLPVIADGRETLVFADLTESERFLFAGLASKKSVVMSEDDRCVLRRLALYGYVREVGPGEWLATANGRRQLDAARKAAMI